MSENEEKKELTLKEFFFDTPIYSPIEVSDNWIAKIANMHGHYREDFEGYNPWSKQESTFYVYSEASRQTLHSSGYLTIKVKCKRSEEIFHFYVLWDYENKKIGKIGQFPSVADFHISEIKKYKKLLSDEKLKEFTRAIGLAANGVGIGSFVYLRRIFEYLIYETFKVCKSEGIIDEQTFKDARMPEKINLLSSHLPKFLVENKGIYSILSRGIHELDEGSCLKHFDVLRVGIEIILDEQLDELKKKNKIEEAKKKLAQVSV